MISRFIVGIFQEEGAIVHAVRTLRKQGLPIYDTYTPYAVHDLEGAMGIKKTRLPWVTFIAGLIGCAVALFVQYWTSAIDWPVIVGGKPGNSLPAFIPVAFELTVLFGGLATVAAFFWIDRLLWGRKPRLQIPGVTDDVFALVLDNSDGSLSLHEVGEELKRTGAIIVKEKVIRNA